MRRKRRGVLVQRRAERQLQREVPMVSLEKGCSSAARSAAEWAVGGEALAPFGLSGSGVDIGAYSLLFGNQR